MAAASSTTLFDPTAEAAEALVVLHNGDLRLALIAAEAAILSAPRGPERIKAVAVRGSLHTDAILTLSSVLAAQQSEIASLKTKQAETDAILNKMMQLYDGAMVGGGCGGGCGGGGSVIVPTVAKGTPCTATVQYSFAVPANPVKCRYCIVFRLTTVNGAPATSVQMNMHLGKFGPTAQAKGTTAQFDMGDGFERPIKQYGKDVKVIAYHMTNVVFASPALTA
jgi:hypothetical protein